MQSGAYTRAVMLITLPGILLDLSSTWPSSDVGGRAPGFQRGFGVIGWFVNSKVWVLGNNIELSLVKPVLLWVHHVQNFRTTVLCTLWFTWFIYFYFSNWIVARLNLYFFLSDFIKKSIKNIWKLHAYIATKIIKVNFMLYL
jgi:hypothetical protein